MQAEAKKFLECRQSHHQEYGTSRSSTSFLKPSLPLYRELKKSLRRAFIALYTNISFSLGCDDLCDVNIFVDPNTGRIVLKEVIDWAEARILPFGDLSTCLTIRVLGDGNNYHNLESLFCQTSEETVG